MRSRFALAAALAAVVVLVVAACGGGDDSSGSSSEPPTQEEFVAAADAVCAEADEKIEALGEPESLEDIGAFLRDGSDIFDEQIDGLRAVGAPEGEEETLNRALELLEQVNGAAKDAAAAFEEGDLAAGQEILESVDPIGEELDGLAADLGLEVCGSADGLG